MAATLYTMLGYPGSGKSHFAKLLATEIGAVWLSNDGMRSSIFDEPTKPENLHNYRVVYGAMDYVTQQILQAGVSVIYDANVNHVHERQKNADLAESCGADAVTVWVKTPVDEAVERVQGREVTAEQFRLDREDVTRHVAILEEPTSSEKCVVIDGTMNAEGQLASLRAQLASIGVVNLR